jgi:hypothetical protein
MNRLITIGSTLILGVATAACNSANRPATVERDVSNAEADRTADVANAHEQGAQAVQRQEKDVDAERHDVSDAKATESYNVALAKADGDYNVATASCGALSGTAQVNCKDQAEAVLKSDKASAELLKPKG